MNYYLYILEVILNCIFIMLNVIFIPDVAVKILRIKYKKYTATLLYIFLNAAVITFFLGFNANIARQYVFLITILNMFISLFYFIVSKESLIEYYLIKNKKYLICSIISIFIVSFYTFYSLKIDFIYNGHDPYFFGIPFEVLIAKYSSRLRVFDHYPFEWTKYHFFNGAVSSLILAPIYLKNIFIYKFSKLIILILSFLSISEFIKFTKNKIIILTILSIIFSWQFRWLYYTNGFISLYLFIIFLIIVKKQFYKLQENQFILLLVLSLFSLSNVRNLIPGMCVLLFIIFGRNYFLKQLGFFKILFLSVASISILSMVFLGDNQINQKTIQFTYRNYLSLGWNDLFLIRNIFLNLKSFIFDNSISFLIRLLWFSALLILLIINRFAVKTHLTTDFNLKKIIILIYFLINGFSILFYTNRILWILSLLCIFFLPIFLVLTHNKCSKTTKFLLITFILASLIQISFIDPGTSIPNAILFDYIIFVCLFCEFKLNVISTIVVSIVILPLFYFQNMIIPPSDRTTKIINIDKLYNEKTNDLETNFIFNTAIMGNRHYHNELLGDSISISKHFISKNVFSR